MKTLRFVRLLPLLFGLAALTGCMKWDYGRPEDFTAPPGGLFIVNEGMFQYGNATLSYYDPAAKHVENEIFYRANAMRLGDVAQSMTVRGGLGWVVVNNSHVVFAIDLDTFREAGRIADLPSPRYIHFVSDEKAYVTQLWDNRIIIVDPRRFEVTGQIVCPGMAVESGSTEQMVGWGDYLFVNCWSYQNRILKIDTRTDEVVGQLTVGIQPTSVALDANGKLWTLTDGGYEGSPYGCEAPALYRIDPARFEVEREFRFRPGDRPSELQTDGQGKTLYWIDDDIWRMDVDEERLPVRPFIVSRGTKYYGLSVDPHSGEVYVADAVDFQQQGMVYRCTAGGEEIDRFYAGVSPGAFCWK